MNTLYPPPNTIKPGSIVDAYLRDSGGEGQDRSVASQLAELQSYCKKYGLILRDIYKDSKSGKSTVGRDDFDRMMSNYGRGLNHPHGLILWDYARFARNSREAVKNIAIIEDRGIVVHSLTDNIPEGEFKDLIRLVKHMGNQAEREKNSVAVKREQHQLVRTYKAMFGIPPRGFIREALPPIINERTGEPRILHKWVPDPLLSHLALRAFEMRAGGATYDQIRAATGLYKSDNCYKGFFENKLYKGVMEFGGMVIDDYCEPIVPLELWDCVNALRRQTRPGNGTRNPRRVGSSFLLSGLCFCQQCGYPLVGHRIKTWKYYICSHRKRTHECGARHIPMEKFETDVLNAIRERALAAEQLIDWQKRIALDVAHSMDDLERARLDLGRTLAATKKQIANLTRAIAQHGHSDSLLSALRLAENTGADIEFQIAEIEKIPAIPKRDIPQLKEIAAHVEYIIAAGDDDDKRLLVRSIITRVVARREGSHVQAMVCYLPVQILNHPTDKQQGVLGLAAVPPRGSFLEEQFELIIPLKR